MLIIKNIYRFGRYFFVENGDLIFMKVLNINYDIIPYINKYKEHRYGTL